MHADGMGNGHLRQQAATHGKPGPPCPVLINPEGEVWK